MIRPPIRCSARAMVCAAAGLLVAAAHAWIVGAGGPPVPMWDQWDFEANALYRPWVDGTFTWKHLFAAHNEHRMVLTRLADLAIFNATGEWTLWPQLLLNAVLNALSAVVLVAVGWPALPRKLAITFAVGVAVALAIPADSMSPMHGIDSAFYFAKTLTVLACGLLARHEPLAPHWWLGVGAAWLALGSLASGVLTAAAIAGALVLLALFRCGAPKAWITLLAMLAIGLLGACLQVSAAAHAVAKAHTLEQFITVLTRSLAWPHVNMGLLWPIAHAPLAWLLFETVRRRERVDGSLRFALMLAIYAALSALAIAYARGGAMPADRPLPRYHQALMLGCVAQLFAICRLAARHGPRGRLALVGWCGIASLGLGSLTIDGLTQQLPLLRVLHRRSHEVARDFLVSGDVERFHREARYPVLHPNSEVPATVMRDPVLRPILPASLRLGPEHPAAAAPWPVRQAPIVFGLAVPLFCAALAFTARRREPA